jgi:hypothetical protein
MIGRKAIAALATVAVGGAIALGGCGGGDDTTSSGNGPTPAGQASNGAMKHADAMKDDRGAMHDGGAMHNKTDDHGGAMKER